MALLKSLTPAKALPQTERDKKYFFILDVVGGGVSLLTMVILCIALAGFDPTYVWSAVAFGLGGLLFYGASFARRFLGGELFGRLADASVYALLCGIYTPIQLILIRQAQYEHHSVVAGWVTFGVTAGFCALFFILSLCSKRKFRLTGAFFYLVLVFSPLFGLYPLLNVYFFAPALMIILLVVMLAALVATPILFWFFDRFPWQMKVVHTLFVVGTVCAALLPLFYVFFGR